MILRSLLFVPGDRPDRMNKAINLGADALIFDLEDSVAISKKSIARDCVAEILKSPRENDVKLFVRINPIESAFFEQDIDFLKNNKPDAIMLPKANSTQSVEYLCKHFNELPPILPIACETAAGLFELGTFRNCAKSLCGITWGAEDLCADIGAATNRGDDNKFLTPYQIARSLTLFASHAAGVPAIDTVYPAIQDIDGLKEYASNAARDGFTGMLAIHPAQIPIINQAFTPSEEQIEYANLIINTFKENSENGVVQINGKMIDAPHIKQAERILERARLNI